MSLNRPMGVLLKGKDKIAADNQINLIGSELVGVVSEYPCSDKNIVIVIFDFRALLFAEDVFNDQLVDVVGCQEVF